MGKGTSRLIVVGVIAVLGGAGCPSQRVQNGHLTSLAQFGNSVSIAGQTAAVGAFQENGTFNQQGAVYVYLQSGDVWNLQARIVAPFPGADDGFGAAVALSDGGDTLAIGAPNADGVGAVFVFARSGVSWTQQAVLELPPPAQLNTSFGVAVALDGDLLVVGAPDRNPGSAAGAGAAFVFQRNGSSWSTTPTALLEPSPAAGDTFGVSVAILGNAAFVGARHRTANFVTDSGAVFVYQLIGTNWTPQPTLTASDGQPHDAFGNALAVSVVATSLPATRYLLVGAPNVALSGVNGVNNVGAAYLFTSTGGGPFNQVVPRLMAVGAAANDTFGSAVALSGSRALVGAPNVQTNGVGAGAAYVFDLAGGTWSQAAELVSATGAPGDALGGAVAVSAGFALAGASNEQIELEHPGSGAVHAFREVTPGTWSASHRLAASQSSQQPNGMTIAVSADTMVAAPFTGLVDVYRRDLDGWSLVQQLPPASPATLGSVVQIESVATDAGRLAIFSKHNPNSTDPIGTVTVYQRGADGRWSIEGNDIVPDLVTMIAPTEPANEGVVVISGDRLVIGAPRFSDGRGRVFVYAPSGSTWTQVQPPLVSADLANTMINFIDMNFGQALALQGDTLAVSEVPLASPTVDANGKVHIYNWNSTNSDFELGQTIACPTATGSIHDGFGTGVTLSGDYLALGPGGCLPGASVSVYKRTAAMFASTPVWSLMSSDAPGVRGLALDGDKLAVGSPMSSTGIGTSPSPLTANVGAVRIFQRQSDDTFSQSILWTPFDFTAGNFFGSFVVSAGGHLVVANGAGTGSVYGMDP